MKIFASILICCLPAFAQTKAPAKTTLDKEKVAAYLSHLELYRGGVKFTVGDPAPSKTMPGYNDLPVHLTFEGGGKDDMYYISPDGQTIVKGTGYDINKNPFQSNIDKLATSGEPAFGAAFAPVTIVEFGDFQCPDCKMEAPVLRQSLPAAFAGKVRVVFKNFPLETIHPWARAAAIAGRCVYRQNQEAFWKYYDWIYETQSDITPENLTSSVVTWAGKNSLDSAKLKGCVDSKETEPDVDRNIAEAHALGATGTPTLFINGRKIGGLQWPDLQMVINLELQYVTGK